MALVLADRVQETSTTTGTGTFTLDGAIAGYVSFAAIGDGNTTYYTIVGGVQWEVGIGTYTASGTTLSRDTVLSSSSGGSLVDFPAGSKTVFVTYPAERAVYENATGAVVFADVTATNANITSTLITDEFTATNANITSSLITDEFTATNANVSVLNASSSVISAEFDNTGVFYYNTKTITANTTIGNTTNAMSVGPITIADEVVVTVSDGGEWVIV